MEVGSWRLNRRRGGASATMNVAAMAMLLTAVGSVMLMSPEIMLVKSSQYDESPLGTMKVAATVTVLKVEEKAGAGKDPLENRGKALTKPVEK